MICIKYLIVINMKYTWDEFKADSVTGIINGITFGTIFSFFTYPFEFDKPETKLKYKGKPIYYYGSWTWRIALGFGILQTSFSAIGK